MQLFANSLNQYFTTLKVCCQFLYLNKNTNKSTRLLIHVHLKVKRVWRVRAETWGGLWVFCQTLKKKKKTAKKLFEVLKSVKTTHIVNVCENNWQTLQLRCLCYKNEDFPTTKPIGKKSLLTTMVTNYSLMIGQRLDGGAEISVVPTEDRCYSDEHPAVLYVLRSFHIWD